MKPSVLWSLILGLGAFGLDRAHKGLQVDLIGWRGGEVVPVTPFFDYVLVWNTGISYGLLGELSPLVLVAIMAAAIVALSVWWVLEDAFWTRAGIALVVGGALSNALDRLVYGAVADFFHFYVGDFSWYVFNIADVAIAVGVVIMIGDALRPRRSGRSS